MAEDLFGAALQDRLKKSQSQLGEVVTRDVGAFNDMLRRANLPALATPPPPRRPSTQ